MAKVGRKGRFGGMSALDLAILHDPSLTRRDGYIRFWRDGKQVYLHCWIWEQLVGPIPPDHEIDHENGIRHDCRINNLRCVPTIVNCRNHKKKSTNTSGTTGVSQLLRHGQSYWIASWNDPITGKQKAKSFNATKLTEPVAKQAAIDYREMIMEYLVAFHNYSDRHGT